MNAPRKAINQLQKTTTLGDGRSEDGLPWANTETTIQKSYFPAHSQFWNVEKKDLRKILVREAKLSRNNKS